MLNVVVGILCGSLEVRRGGGGNYVSGGGSMMGGRRFRDVFWICLLWWLCFYNYRTWDYVYR
jgi:hypothetical protein